MCPDAAVVCHILSKTKTIEPCLLWNQSLSCLPPSIHENCQKHNGQDDQHYNHQAAALVTGRLLILCGLSVLDVRLPCVLTCVLDVVLNSVERLALFTHNLCHLSEQNVEVAHTLLNIANLLLALDDKGLLEIDLVLVSQLGLLNLLLLLELLERRARGIGTSELALLSCTSGCDGCLLFLQCASLKALEIL